MHLQVADSVEVTALLRAWAAGQPGAADRLVQPLRFVGNRGSEVAGPGGTGPTHRRARIRNRSIRSSPAPTSPANFYLRDTLRLMSDPPLPGGPVAMLANCSPSGAMKRSKDGPLGTSTVKTPVQSASTV